MEALYPGLLVGYGVKFEDLTISHELGRGGFGAVCAGLYYSQEVAVKQQQDEKATVGKTLKAMEKEYLLHFHLRHENVTSVLCFNVDPQQGPITLVMEKLDASLDDLLHAPTVPLALAGGFLACLRSTKHSLGKGQAACWNGRTPLPLSLRLSLLLGVARGLAFLHGRGMIHLDIKPANLMMDARSVTKNTYIYGCK
jgi:serine/threonine protein kinase